MYGIIWINLDYIIWYKYINPIVQRSPEVQNSCLLTFDANRGGHILQETFSTALHLSVVNDCIMLATRTLKNFNMRSLSHSPSSVELLAASWCLPGFAGTIQIVRGFTYLYTIIATIVYVYLAERRSLHAGPRTVKKGQAFVELLKAFGFNLGAMRHTLFCISRRNFSCPLAALKLTLCHKKELPTCQS